MDPLHDGKTRSPASSPNLDCCRKEVQSKVMGDPNISLQNGPVAALVGELPETGKNGSDLENSDPTPIWLRRLKLVIFVAFSIEVGIFLAIVPWKSAWTDNALLTAYPTLRVFLRHDFVRGAVSGLGLIDVWLGIWEAVHYREHRTNPVR